MQGQLGEAEELLLRALPILQRNKSPEYVTILKSVSNLAKMYKQGGKLAEAGRTALVVLQGYEQALGSHHKDTLETAAMIGHLCQKQHLLVQAQRFFLQALHGYDQILGEEDTSTLGLSASLAEVYQELDKHAEAEKLLLRAFRGYHHKLGSDHLNTANAAYNLATVCTMQGKFIEAEKMYRQALKVYMAKMGPKNTFTTDAIYNLASILIGNEKLAEAEDLLFASLEVQDKADGTNNVFICDAMMNLGTVYLRQGKLREAEDMYLQALKGYEKSLSLNNMATLNALCQLGDLHIQQNKLSEASVMYLRALKGYEGLLGSDITTMSSTVAEPETHPPAEARTANTMRRLVQVSVQGESSSKGPNIGYTTTLKVLRDLVTLHFEKRELSEAESLCFRLLKATEKTLGSENPCTLQTADILSSILLDQCRRNCMKEDHSSVTNNIGDEVEGQLSHKSIRQLTKLSEKYGKSKKTIFGDLGRALLHMGDYLNATAAFKNQHSLNEGERIICDHCTNSLTSKTGRYVCETCRDADLCEACWNSWMDEEWDSMTCEGHIYFEVVLGTSLDESGTAASTLSLASLMHSLKCTYEDGKPGNTEDDAGFD
jgi:tetratricopeptide (TPR) repeat protein